MNYTAEQIAKWNNGCKNDWRFDLRNAVFNRDKALCKVVYTDDPNTFIMAQLYFGEEHQSFRLIGKRAKLHISLWKSSTGGYATSSGLGYFENMGDLVKRASFKTLQDLTATLDDAAIMERAKTHIKQLQKETII